MRKMITNDIKTTSKKYAIDVETFLQYAHEVTELESEDNE